MGEEDHKTIDLLLALPVSRVQILAGKYLAMLAATAALGVVLFLSLWAGAPLATTAAQQRAILWRSGLMVAVFSLSIPVAFWAPRVAPFTWLTLFVVRVALRGRWRTDPE